MIFPPIGLDGSPLDLAVIESLLSEQALTIEDEKPMVDSQSKSAAPGTDIGFWSALQLRYSYTRLQWMVLTVASISALYMSSQEIWTVADGRPFPELSTEWFLLYVAFFSAILFAVHLRDTKELTSRKWTMVLLSVVSIIIDICALGFAEWVVLKAIQVLPQESLSTIKILLLGAMPGALGVVTLSSLTVDILKEKASRLKQKAEEIHTQIKLLEKKREDSEADLDAFKKKMREFEENYAKAREEADRA